MSHHAARYRQIDDCRQQAIEMMLTPRGLEAAEGMYYTEMFNWLFGKLEQGVIPTGIPSKFLEEWKSIGEYRKQFGLPRIKQPRGN